MATNVEGVFAAGDVQDKVFRVLCGGSSAFSDDYAYGVVSLSGYNSIWSGSMTVDEGTLFVSHNSA